ncbi:hypothetical protein D0Z07_9132 [Hyphodiscus hymeniophilus]|uniref:Uncharacterized protein n=1 Tax=Hyphodiscus hymeniophilus TaxID=353542 RepID=A0A9P6SKC1_9HELO|nr:hypothetical protein D0Z07_9132 [Hyphodiscus hymeniophilus]
MAKSKVPTTMREKQSSTSTSTLLSLQSNSEIWYKIHILLYDLCNIASDQAAEARTLATTDELYISGPYFSPEEAMTIKATLVPRPSLNEIPEFESLCMQDTDENEVDESSKDVPTPETMTIEAAIKCCLETFFEKRRAIGDARPCGPHDMGPIYQAVFGITKEDLKNEKFLSRLRRTGLGQPKEKEKSESESVCGKQKKNVCGQQKKKR